MLELLIWGSSEITVFFIVRWPWAFGSQWNNVKSLSIRCPPWAHVSNAWSLAIVTIWGVGVGGRVWLETLRHSYSPWWDSPTHPNCHELSISGIPCPMLCCSTSPSAQEQWNWLWLTYTLPLALFSAAFLAYLLIIALKSCCLDLTFLGLAFHLHMRFPHVCISLSV